MKFGTDFKCPQIINSNNFSDPLTFNLASAVLGLAKCSHLTMLNKISACYPITK